MGLDMFAKVRNAEIEADVDFEWEENDEELHYWRKHPDLHGWMEELYRDKGGTDDMFNCAKVRLTLEDLDDLEECIRSNKLPHTEGFFFGKSNWEEHTDDDLRFVEKARQAINAGQTVYYTSWW